jgi:hypothetical protein
VVCERLSIPSQNLHRRLIDDFSTI